MSKKTPARELIRLAMIYAEQDRSNMAECDSGEEGQKAATLAREFHAYRMKHWGATTFEAAIANATTVDVTPCGLVPTAK
jgi:hypothetical protein